MKTRGNSILNALFAIVTHQCMSLVAAGTEIITVKVLKSIRVVWANPTIYIWWPQTKKPRKAMVYMEYIKLALAETRFLK
jgi:uracil DNA glycosylase